MSEKASLNCSLTKAPCSGRSLSSASSPPRFEHYTQQVQARLDALGRGLDAVLARGQGNRRQAPYRRGAVQRGILPHDLTLSYRRTRLSYENSYERCPVSISSSAENRFGGDGFSRQSSQPADEISEAASSCAACRRRRRSLSTPRSQLGMMMAPARR